MRRPKCNQRALGRNSTSDQLEAILRIPLASSPSMPVVDVIALKSDFSTIIVQTPPGIPPPSPASLASATIATGANFSSSYVCFANRTLDLSLLYRRTASISSFECPFRSNRTQTSSAQLASQPSSSVSFAHLSLTVLLRALLRVTARL